MTSKVFEMSFAQVYPLIVDKVEKKGKTKAQLDEIIFWLTGYDAEGLSTALNDGRNLESFFCTSAREKPEASINRGSGLWRQG